MADEVQAPAPPVQTEAPAAPAPAPTTAINIRPSYDRAAQIQAQIAKDAPADGAAEGSSEASPSPGLSQGGGSLGTPGEAASGAEEPKTDRDLRREFLELSRAKRQADAERKEARQERQRAQAVTSAAQNWKQDPAAVLQSLGVDPDLFQYELAIRKAGGDPPKPDPVAEKVKELTEPAIKQLEEERAAIKNQREANELIAVVMQRVYPLVNAAPDKFETLIDVHMENPYNTSKSLEVAKRFAAQEIFNEVRREYTERYNRAVAKGRDPERVERELQPLSFEVVGDAIERFYASKIEATLAKATTLTKFKARVAASPPAAQTQAPQIRTLSNRGAAPPLVTSTNGAAPRQKYDRAAAIAAAIRRP